MSRYITPGRSKVWFAVTVTTATSPTDLEIQAGTDLTPALRGMPSIPRTGNTVDTSTLDSTFEKRQRGTVGGDVMTFQLIRDTSTETEYDALAEGDEGYMAVFRKGIAGTQPDVADVCDVYPITVNAIGDGSPGRNDPDFAMVECVITDNPTRDYAVVST